MNVSLTFFFVCLFVYHREFVRAEKFKSEAESFGWSFVFHDFVSDELKSKVTQKIEVLMWCV